MKKKISEALSILRKHGFTVINNNYNRKFSKAMAGFVDYVIYDYHTVYFIEVKIGKDKFSEEQELTKKKLTSIAEKNNGVVYLTVQDDIRAKQLVDYLITTKVLKNKKKASNKMEEKMKVIAELKAFAEKVAEVKDGE